MESRLIVALFAGIASLLAFNCQAQHETDKHMKFAKLLEAVHNDRIEFLTMRPPDSPFATLERRVVVTGPEELVRLSGTGEVQVLKDLVELLKNPERAWAAEVLLAAMTGREAKMVDSFAATPEQWWPSVGKSASERWSDWLTETEGKLVWDADNGTFVETDEGNDIHAAPS